MSDLEDEIRRIVREEIAAAFQPANDQSEQMTVADYATRWAISETTVRDAIREKRLEVTRIGRAIRIASDAKIKEHAADDVRERVRSRLLGQG